VVFDNLSNGWSEWVKFRAVSAFGGDIRDEEALFRGFDRLQDRSGHSFRCKGPMLKSHTDCPTGLFRQQCNVRYRSKAMKRAGTKPWYFQVHAPHTGNAETATIREDHTQAPTNPYGLSEADVRAGDIAAAPVFGLRYAMLRYFNVIGNDPEGEIFEKTRTGNHVLPNLVSAAMSGSSFCLFGTNHATPDGTAVRRLRACDGPWAGAHKGNH